VRVFWTLLIDSLRLLRARALFWITLAISALAAVIYLSIGFTPTGLSMMFGMAEFDNPVLRAGTPAAELFYLGLFSKFIVGVWLSWVAIGLAIISCAPVFPDFMAEGSIGIPLSKPVSRLKLFLYKYIGSLMFVVLQVGLFCAIVFFAVRWRVGTWNPSVFWAVPLVTLVFSYLYSVVVLVAVKTRSVLPAILAGILIWFASWVGQQGEQVLYKVAYLDTPGEVISKGEESNLQEWHRRSVWLMACLPKTGETVNLMDRHVVVGGKTGFSNSGFIKILMGMESSPEESVDQAIARHSTLYIIGTSLIFEGVMLGLAAWIFCRRDF
jgi:ABC-type transport system involved in multi-copper enzyme maturation permease subunit